MRVIVVAVAAMLATTGPGRAADLSVAPPPPPAPAYGWNGVYIGANAGYVFGGVDTTAPALGAATSQNAGGYLAGGQLGVNYQVGSIVWGAEVDFDASGQSQTLSGALVTGTNQLPWFTTFRGRLGYAFDRLLFYGTAGGAAGEIKSNLTLAGVNAITSQTYATWTAGAGVEYRISDVLSARIDYLYLDTGNVDVALVGPVTVTTRARDNMVRAGLNLRWPVAW